MSELKEASGSKGTMERGSHERLAEPSQIKAGKARRPKFQRQESWRYKKLSPAWRRPKGLDSKMRIKKKGWPKSVEIGYRSPKDIRGLHPSGFEEIMVFNVDDLEKINSWNVARIAHTVGMKKRLQIIEKAKELDIHILNTRGVGEVEPKESEKTSG
jgi:large subunit ribosomal protein L32e